MLTNILSSDRNLKIIALIYRLFVLRLEREKKTFHFRSDFVRKRAESAFRHGIENRFARESSFKQQKQKRQKYYEPLILRLPVVGTTQQGSVG